MIILVDNHDSFTYNIVHALWLVGQRVKVVQAADTSIDELSQASAIVLGPGPGRPHPIAKECVHKLQIPILGICLGHQAIAEAFGGRIGYAPLPVHGKEACIYHNGSALFRGVMSPFVAARYHSLLVEEEGLPPELYVTARTEQQEVMAIEHRSRPIFGLQFHPESILCDSGTLLLENFLRISGSDSLFKKT